MQRSCILKKTPHDLFSSLSFMYSTILNVVKHGKRVKHKQTNYLSNLNGAGYNKQQIGEIPMCIF